MRDIDSIWIDTVLNPLYSYEVAWIKSAQDQFADKERLLLQASQLGDPSKAFYLFFPLIFGLNQAIGTRYLGAAIVCEWLNQILKWLLHGHRPYWWIQLHLPHLTMQFKQTPISCETGPGNPSGHVMIGVVTCASLYKLYKSYFGSGQNPGSLVLNRIVGNVLLAWVAIIAASRIYILAHFPHQCTLAVLVGLASFRIAFSERLNWNLWSSSQLVIASMLLVTSALLVFSKAEDVLQFNINWALALAGKFCAKKEWIHIDTTPLYAMMRYSGSALGLAFSHSSIDVAKSKSRSMKIATLITSLVIGFGMHSLQKAVAQDNMMQFYVTQYFFNAFSIYSIVKVSYFLQ